MEQRQKTFKTIKALSERWQLSECFIWSLAITGWEAANGGQRLVAKKHYKYAGAMFAEEDIQSWVDSHPAEYAERITRSHNSVTAESRNGTTWY